MGYCGLKISGHSETSFKHRKAFQTRKANLQKSMRYGLKKYKHTVIEPYKDTSEERSTLKSKIIASRSLKIISISGLLFIILLFPYFIYLGLYNIDINAKSISQERTIEKQKEKGNAYEMQIKAGQRYLKNGKLDDAQYEFVLALSNKKYGIEARKGLYNVLDLKCIEFGLLCNEAQENKEYLIAINQYDR